MKRKIIAGIGLLLLILIVAMAQQSNNSTPSTEQTDRGGESKAAATEAIKSLRGLVDGQNFRELGFESQDEAGSAALGEPVPVLIVRLDQLKEFQAGGDANRLLTESQQVIYPVLVNGQVRSSITLTQQEGRWTPAAFGGAKMIRQLSAARDGARSANAAASYSFVKVPALNVYFLATRSEAAADLMVTPLGDYPDFKLKGGGSISAKEAFAALVPAARAHDGKLS